MNYFRTWLKQTEAMEILGCKRTTLYKLRKENRIIFSKLGRKVYVSKESLEKLLNENASVFNNAKQNYYEHE